jgi:hypothetical protein
LDEVLLKTVELPAFLRFVREVVRGLQKGLSGGRKNKKGGENSTFFAPNLTMNLTYLCYGFPKVRGMPASNPKSRRTARFVDKMHKRVYFIDQPQ